MSIPTSTSTFNEFYAKWYGPRWETLLAALKKDNFFVARKNLFSKDDAQTFSKGRVSPIKDLPNCYTWETMQAPRSNQYYLLDPASLLPVLALEPTVGDSVLDLCASPGGKSLVIAEKLWAKASTKSESSELTCNDASRSRMMRLNKVLTLYLPKNINSKIRLSNRDGIKLCLKVQDRFDKILVDAPCSSERHLLHKPKEMKTWSSKRSQSLGKRQYALLASALKMLKPGGRLVYSTCSISPYENDGVIEKLFKKKKRLPPFQVVPSQEYSHLGESTEYGQIILPDTQNSWGPIYFSCLRRPHIA